MNFEQKVEFFMYLSQKDNLEFIHYVYSKAFELYFNIEFSQTTTQVQEFYFKLKNDFFMKNDSIEAKFDFRTQIKTEMSLFRTYFSDKEYEFLIQYYTNKIPADYFYLRGAACIYADSSYQEFLNKI